MTSCSNKQLVQKLKVWGAYGLSLYNYLLPCRLLFPVYLLFNRDEGSFFRVEPSSLLQRWYSLLLARLPPKGLRHYRLKRLLGQRLLNRGLWWRSNLLVPLLPHRLGVLCRWREGVSRNYLQLELLHGKSVLRPVFLVSLLVRLRRRLVDLVKCVSRLFRHLSSSLLYLHLHGHHLSALNSSFRFPVFPGRFFFRFDWTSFFFHLLFRRRNIVSTTKILYH